MSIATEIGEFEIPDYAQAWLDRIEKALGNKCGNCGTWRVLLDRHIERCGACHENEYDIHETVLNMEFLP